MASRKVLYKIKEAHKFDSQLVGYNAPEPIPDLESKKVRMKEVIIGKMEDTCKMKD